MINLRFIPRLALLRSIWIHPIQSKDRNSHSFPKWISSGPITPYRLFVSWPPRYTHTYTHTRVCHPSFYEWTRHVESLSRRNNHGFSLRPTSICYCPFHAKIYAPWNYEAPLSSKSSIDAPCQLCKGWMWGARQEGITSESLILFPLLVKRNIESV